MTLKAYKTIDGTYALRVTLESNILNSDELNETIHAISYTYISTEMYISIHKAAYPLVNVDEYFSYLHLTGVNTRYFNSSLLASFAILLNILETKYGIEYVDAED